MSGIIGDNTGTGSGQIATVQGITTSSSDPAIDTDPLLEFVPTVPLIIYSFQSCNYTRGRSNTKIE